MSDSSSNSSEESNEDKLLDDLRRLRDNDPTVTRLVTDGLFDCIQDMTDDGWEQLGRDISNSNSLQDVAFSSCIDDHSMTSLFRGLTRSTSIDEMTFNNNDCGVNGIRSMVPFLQNANNLLELFFSHDNISSEGFSLIWGALRDSPINTLTFVSCQLSSIEIDVAYVPNCLIILNLSHNEINADGCREVAKLLRMENATLEHLHLFENKIDDEGISYLVSALRTNTSLRAIKLHDNEGITIEGMRLLLKLLNDISSIEATLQSNHFLILLTFHNSFDGTDIGRQIRRVLQMNRDKLDNPDVIGKKKVICTQLDSKQRADMCRLQGVKNSGKPLTELGPLLLPEVLEIVGNHHGLSGFYESFRTSVADLWTTINREVWLQQKIEELSQEIDVLATKKLELEKQREAFGVEVAEMRQQSAAVANDGSHSSKRPRMA